MTYHELPVDRSEHEHSGGFLIGLLAGAAVGGGLALLFAPRQGADIRQGLAEGAQQASRRLTQAYGSVAGTARRSARRLTGQDAGLREAGTSDSIGDRRRDFTSGQERDRADDPTNLIRGAIGETAYEPAAVPPSDRGPGSTSSAPADPRSPLV